MDRKGFGVVELLLSLVILGLILGIGLYNARGTLSTALTTMDQISRNELYNVVEVYLMENGVTWINNVEEYTCVEIDTLVNMGYFERNEVNAYKDKVIRVVREQRTKVINSKELVDICE